MCIRINLVNAGAGRKLVCSPLSYVRSWFSIKTGISVVSFFFAMTYMASLAAMPARSSLSLNSTRARSVPIPSLRCTLSGSRKVLMV